MNDLSEQLNDLEDKNETLQRIKKKLESDNESLKKSIADMELIIRKQEAEKQTKDHQLRSFQVIFFLKKNLLLLSIIIENLLLSIIINTKNLQNYLGKQ